MSTYAKHPEGTTSTFYEMTVNIPPPGAVWDYYTGKWIQTEIYSRSEVEKDQYWERPIPAGFNYHRLRAVEERKQETNKSYVDPELEAFREQEWRRRINGFWFMNNGVPTYITGCHYFYLTWWKIDIGYPSYRASDREFFYMWKYCEDDPNSFGLVEAARRRSGKTYRATVIMYEHASRVQAQDNFCTMQSKTRPDAGKIFSKMVNAFKVLPDFFQPVYDTSGGTRPKNKLVFLPKNKSDEERLEGLDPLGTEINFESYEILAVDGTKQLRYLRDECFGEDTELIDEYGNGIMAQHVKVGDKLMGDDGSPRKVIYINEGEDKMYSIVPKKGKPWTCNGPHKLIVSWRRRDYDFLGKYKFGEKFKISVEDYMRCSKSQKRHLMMHIGGPVDFNVNEELSINPYDLGLWLGDGSSHKGTIYNEDKEIISHLLRSYDGSYVFHEEGRCPEIRLKSGFQKKLREMGVLKNKHIPSQYMLSPIEERFKLLAGIIDSDGFAIKRNGRVVGYEITQKNEVLSKSIQRLCRDLGLYATISDKIATMKRDDGSIYKSNVFRILIHGDLELIPVIVDRKKPKTNHHSKKKTHNVFSFDVKELGVETFYSIRTEGNELIRNSDGVIVKNCGKTELADIAKGWDIVQPCLMVGTWTIVGKAYYTTTIEEGGSIAFKKLWDDSCFTKKNEETDRTTSGLYRTFTAAYKNDADYIDIYGNCDEEAAMEGMMSIRKSLAHNPKKLAEYKRKNPFNVKEAFFSINDECIYDTQKINDQAEALSHVDEDHWFVRGNLRWEDGIGSDVYFQENYNGHWRIHRKFLEMCEESPAGSMLNRWMKQGDLFVPLNDTLGLTGADTFDHSLKNLADDKQASDAAFYTYWRNDIEHPEFSDTFICEYIHRQPTADLMSEDLLKQCVFFGTPCIMESNKPGAISYFVRNGYRKFVQKVNAKEGIPASPQNKQSGAECTEKYIADHCEKVVFTNLLMDWNEFSLENSTQFDAAMAAMWVLLVIDRLGKKYQEKPDHLKRLRTSRGSNSKKWRKYL